MPRSLDGRVSAAQLAALRLAACGYTSRQIAERVGSTELAVHLRLNQAARSLGARSRVHAVAIAIVTGLIDPYDVEMPPPAVKGGTGAA